ncbi:DUF5787 family protein [Natrarchaeobaculum sulfurireducens]|uniref:Uncharacterized protein n=1 Tax=Natrarchaeobaculum sulfurireducens TaxID=2044521 RepID=A0A346PAM8_9EURY|nr:DUF5787 family protein [Natrarchaeobaculum sulfurireducens]AXR76573.1 hypothetical protein AArc1_0229 [Natrarchaeobaculum sulfurireducens]AXR80250.1 hypothetical protein AArcMg_0227 [Natrarchaeobaculum sulfurireducens]
MSEFAFELALCAHLEGAREEIIARQLGASVADPGGRILDVVCVEPGPGFDDRTAITSESIPDAAIESAVGPGRARYWKDAFDCHPDRARRATERALEIGFFESHRLKGREYVRQVARYPDWYGRIVGIENKPDLGRPGDLEAQLRTDVSLALVDAAVLATESYVTRAHLNRIPEEVGVWRVHRDETGDVCELEVVREPVSLPVERPGIEPLAYEPGRTDVAVVDAEAKARRRRRIAERAYGKGWRTYGFPGCANGDPVSSSGATLPYCAWAGRVVDVESECGPSCPGYEPVERPAVDLEAERDRLSPWIADPVGKQRRQSGLDRFG